MGMRTVFSARAERSVLPGAKHGDNANVARGLGVARVWKHLIDHAMFGYDKLEAWFRGVNASSGIWVLERHCFERIESLPS